MCFQYFSRFRKCLWERVNLLFGQDNLKKFRLAAQFGIVARNTEIPFETSIFKKKSPAAHFEIVPKNKEISFETSV